MKIIENPILKILIILLGALLSICYGQNPKCKILLDSAKTLFKNELNFNQEQLDKFDYNQIVTLLEEAVESDSENSEARYFLGYAYSRINSRDGRSMVDMDLKLVEKSSEQFEKVIQLTPYYTGEIIILDPYSKLTSEWGSMAMSFWYNNKPDSALWAFREGKNRGGFSDFNLELTKCILDACSKNSILLSSGDNSSIPLWYLQIVEKYRTDVSIVDINLLNSIWYPAFISKNKSVAFDIPDESLDTVEYISWSDSTITINNFSWIVKPSYYEQYLLRGDRLFLSLLKQNDFQRDIFFTIGFIENSRLCLNNYLTSLIIVDKLSIFNKIIFSDDDYKNAMSKVLSLSNLLNKNSSDEMRLFNYFLYDLFSRANEYLENHKQKKAKELILLYDNLVGKKFESFQDENLKLYIEYLRQKLL